MAEGILTKLVEHAKQHPGAQILDAVKTIGAQDNTFARGLVQLFARIDGLLPPTGPVLIAIDGNSAAGKTSLAALIQKAYDANVFHMDDFFLPLPLKTKERLQEPGGNVHYERFSEEVISGLISGRAFRYRPFSCSRQELGEAVLVQPRQVNVVEGAYSMHPALIDRYCLKVFLAIDPQEQSRRILKRNGPVLHKRFLSEWIPLENKYFAELKIKEQCDIVLHQE